MTSGLAAGRTSGTRDTTEYFVIPSEARDLGRRKRRPTPDTSPLRLAQHDICEGLGQLAPPNPYLMGMDT
jgi:hypothetical protein